MLSGSMCRDHPEEKLRFLCVPCDVLVCRDCKLTEHEGHRSTDVSKALADLKEKLQYHRQRLQDRLSLLDKVSQGVDKDKRAAQEALKHLETHINDRAAVLATWVENSKQQALEALDVSSLMVNTNMDSMSSDLDWRRQNMQEMVASIECAVSSIDRPGADQDEGGPAMDQAAVFSLEREMRTGRGKGENLERLTEGLPMYSATATLLGESDSLTAEAVKNFLGNPVYTQVTKTAPKVALSPLFQCEGVASDARLNALCPMPDGTVWVAHDAAGGATTTTTTTTTTATSTSTSAAGDGERKSAQRVALYTRDGRVLRVETLTTAGGGASIARAFGHWAYLVGRQGTKLLLHRDETREAITEKDESSLNRNQQSKQKPKQNLPPRIYSDVALSKLNARFSVQSCRPGEAGGAGDNDEAKICAVQALPVPCPWVESDALFTINTRDALALDVNSAGDLFAVLLPGLTVCLYREAASPKPVCTYRPWFENFSPADVCFHRLDHQHDGDGSSGGGGGVGVGGGTEVLLVADCLNSAVHVLDVSTKDALRFLYYLGAGCPLISQPTCLTSDGKTLLIGCKGGQVLVCRSAAAAVADAAKSSTQ